MDKNHSCEKQQKETVYYNQMMEKAAMTMSESLAYGNFTKNTYTYYERKGFRGGKEIIKDLEECRIRFVQKLHPEDREEFEKRFSVNQMHDQLQNGEEVYGEFRKESEDDYYWISFRCILIDNPFDEDELCMFIVRDIHRRKQMEWQLAAQLNATYQSIPGGVAVVQLDHRLSIINASEAFYDMMGKTEEDYENGYLAHIERSDRQSVLARIREVKRTNGFIDIVYREADSQKNIHWVQARGQKISNEAGVPVYLLIRMDVTELKVAQEQLLEDQRQWRIYTERVVDTLSNLVEFRDLDSGEHIKRTRSLTRILLQSIRERHPDTMLTDESIEKIAEAAALHDVGKISISDTILNKPGKLTYEEFEEMKNHTIKGYEILKTLNLSQDEEQRRYSLDISRYHHERWDGSGYPDHLKGDEIPIWSQVVSIVDVYDALVSNRVYKQAYTHETAIRMILDGECGVFNPKLLECFKESVELFEQQYQVGNIA